ncbi:peptidase S28 [Gigaspora rosea]|uniref:Peptidase S28 n=1 Tax=Gigaspora rosea TaxID=44941 RepID=A0A397VQZ4_9GLOM|nr:peptidase S28 [Gigaspora rosea]
MKTTIIFFILVVLLDCSVLSVHLTSNVYARNVNETSQFYYYKQFIDHYDKSCGTFSQRFLINSTYYKPGGPIFLNTPGEGPITVKASGISEIAASFNGLLITIEHRYYGESYPSIKNLTTPNMKFLTVNQVLADFAEFIKNPPTDIIKIPKDAKWIFVGGSYAGNLATWMRKKFPKLVFAAWASSAPLLTKINFFEYDQGVAHALPCHDRVADAFKFVIDPILLSGNRTEITALKSQFGLDVLDDDQDFASAISHPVSLMVQSYFPPTSPSEIDTIPTFCAAFTKAPDNKPETSTLILAQVTKFFLNVSGITTPDAIKTNFATSALNTSVPNDMVSFMYQYCTQFGWYQIAPKPPKQSLRSQIVNRDYYQKQCNFVFPEIPPPHVKRIVRQFGGNTGRFSRTIFINGELDPWKHLTISGSYHKTISRNKVFLIKYASHINDLRFPTSVDSDSLKCARKFIIETLAKWLCVKCITDVSGFVKCQ